MSAANEFGLSESPFPGLRPFLRDEADVFFGREEQVDQLLGKLETRRFLAVVGVSGCGKSSLVRAGMLSALEGGFMASAGPRWHIVEMRPGSHPLHNLARSLMTAGVLGEQWTSHENADAYVEAVLRRGPLGLVELMRESLSPDTNNLLLLVDQFEEVFRFHRHGDAGDATAFVDLLLSSAQQSETPIYVVLTMRSDFLGDCSLFAGLPEAINEGQFLIPRLSREQCRAAILGPPAAFDAEVEPELVNRVLNDLGSDPDQLPLMQHALMRVWNRAAEHTNGEAEDNGFTKLTLSAYDDVGGLKNALSHHADERFASLSPEDRDAAEAMFRCLSERGADGRDIRRPAPLHRVAEVAQTGYETVARIVEVFRDPTCSFLTPPAGVPLEPDTVLDISHESLIRQWRKMTAWVQTEADSAAIYRRLHETAELWRENRAALWVTPDLENALSWRDREQPNPVWAERYGGGFEEAMRFLDASVQAHESAKSEEQERQRRERELLENMAAAEKQRADEQAAANQLIKKKALAALIAGVAALLLAVIATVLFLHARKQRDDADQARSEAVAARKSADEAAQNEADQRERAERLAAASEADRKRAEQARIDALGQTLEADENLAAGNLARLQSLWNAAETGRQQQALTLLKQTGELWNSTRKLFPDLGDDPQKRRQRSELAWKALSPQLRGQAVRWLTHTSLQPVRMVEFDDSDSVVRLFALDPTGQKVVLYRVHRQNRRREFQVWDAATGNLATVHRMSPEDTSEPVAIQVLGRFVMIAMRHESGSSKLSIEHRDLEGFQKLGEKRLYAGNIGSLSEDSNYRFIQLRTSYGVLTKDRDKTTLWDADSGKRLVHDPLAIPAVGPCLDNELVLVKRMEVPRLAVVNVTDGSVIRETPLPGVIPPEQAWRSPDGRWIAVTQGYQYRSGYEPVGYVDSFRIIDARIGETASQFELAQHQTSHSSTMKPRLTFHPTEPLLTAVVGRMVYLISVPGGSVVHSSRTTEGTDSHTGPAFPLQARFSPDGRALLTAVRERRQILNKNFTRLQVWDPSLAKASMESFSAEGRVNDFEFTGDAVAVASGSGSQSTLRLHSAKNDGWSHASTDINEGFEPSGRHFVRLLPGYADVLDAETGKRVARVESGNSAAPRSSPDYHWILGKKMDGDRETWAVFNTTSLEWSVSIPKPAQFGNPYVFLDQTYLCTQHREDREIKTLLHHLPSGKLLFTIPQGFQELRLTNSFLLGRRYENGQYINAAYDLGSGKKTSEVNQSSSYTSGLHYNFWVTPDGSTAVYARQSSRGYRLAFWRFADGPPELTEKNVDYIQGLPRLSNTRAMVLVRQPRPATQRYAVQLWDIAARKLIRQQEMSSTRYIGELDITPKSTAIVGVSDSRCELWDARNGRVAAAWSQMPREQSNDGRYLLFADGTVVDCSDPKYGLGREPFTEVQVPAVVTIGNSVISRAAFTSDSRYLISITGEPRKTTIRDLTTNQVRVIPDLYGPRVVSSDSRMLAVFDEQTQMLHIVPLAGGPTVKCNLHIGSFRKDAPAKPAVFRFSPDGRHLSVTVSHQTRLVNTNDGSLHSAFPRTGHRDQIAAICIDPGGQFIATASADGTICFWSKADGRYLGMLENGTTGLRDIAISPAGHLLATRSTNGEIAVWRWSRADGGEVRGEFLWADVQTREGPITFNQDGTILAAVDSGGSIRLMNTADGKLTGWLKPVGNISLIRDLEYHPSRPELAAPVGNRVAIWNVATQEPVHSWDAGQGPIFDLAYANDGRMLVTAGRDVRLWNPRLGRLQLTLERDTAVRRIALDKQGRRLAFTVDPQSLAVANAGELLKAVDEMGLNFAGLTAPDPRQVVSREPLWTPASADELARRNVLTEHLPLAAAAEREQRWQDAVAHLSRAIEVDPKNLHYRQRRATAALELEDFTAAAVDYNVLLMSKEYDRHRNSDRSKFITEIIRRQPRLFDELLKLRPRDTLLKLAQSRDFIAQSKWQQAFDLHEQIIDQSPIGEEWFEFAMLCRLTGNQAAFEKHRGTFLSRWSDNSVYQHYVRARIEALNPQSQSSHADVIKWADVAVADKEVGWYLHVAGLARFRAGRLDEAEELFQRSIQQRWSARYLNSLALALLELKRGNHHKSVEWWKEALRWQLGIEANKVDGRIQSQLPDWLELNVLRREAERLLPAVAEHIVPTEDATAARAKALLGTWVYASAVMAGQKLTPPKVQIVFGEKTMGFTRGDRSESAAYTVDFSNSPATIDVPSQSMRGILEIDGDTLKICLGEGERPTVFNSTAENKWQLMELKRVRR